MEPIIIENTFGDCYCDFCVLNYLSIDSFIYFLNKFNIEKEYIKGNKFKIIFNDDFNSFKDQLETLKIIDNL
jgi:hypothetical protein